MHADFHWLGAPVQFRADRCLVLSGAKTGLLVPGGVFGISRRAAPLTVGAPIGSLDLAIYAHARRRSVHSVHGSSPDGVQRQSCGNPNIALNWRNASSYSCQACSNLSGVAS